MRKDYAPQFNPKPKPSSFKRFADTVLGAFAIMAVGCLFGLLMLAWLGLL